ncbi:hypothetical protein H0H93_007880 [Arthromyces matolae]|nr:hypothetical protein H0H93_007880 [Arthromyces matolae]
MAPYSLLESEVNQKLLGDSEAGDKEGYLDPVIVAPSKRVVALVYIACALAVLLAFTNVIAALHIRDATNKSPSIDSLPRPDIFAGLPAHHEAVVMKEGHHHHSHNHTQGN